MVHCYEVAIAGKNGTEKFYTTNRKNIQGSSRSNTLFKGILKDKKKQGKKIGTINEILVKTCNINTFLEEIRTVDLLKLNCEGGEYEIFDGELNFLEKTKMIYVSFHAQNKPFNKPEYKEKRAIAYKNLESADFMLKTEYANEGKHVWQLWAKS